MSHISDELSVSYVLMSRNVGSSCVVIVCEHASYYIPKSFNTLGLSKADQTSHAAWDPGALGVAKHLARKLDATLVASRVSRLVYDCNRHPSARDAMPVRSEVIEVPGNQNLSQSDRDARIHAFYRPFHNALQDVIRQINNPIIVTVHSFTPVYHGHLRSVEIGILHDTDARLANAMLQVAQEHTAANVQRNEPYGPEHGVTHTLKEHAINDRYLNVMLEIRNDLIETATQQNNMANIIATWLTDACIQIDELGCA